MTTAKHTPGPWVVKPTTSRVHNFRVESAQDCEDIALCIELADARLIAAAPDLLTALEALANEYGPHTGRMASTSPRRALWLQARTAIARATGEDC